MLPVSRECDRPASRYATADEVNALRAEVADLRAQLVEARGSARARSLTREDAALLARLLPVLAAVFGSDVLFTTHEIRQSDQTGLHLVTRGVSARRLGKLLARACGHAIAGYTVQRVGEESHRAVWRVLGCVSLRA